MAIVVRTKPPFARLEVSFSPDPFLSRPSNGPWKLRLQQTPRFQHGNLFRPKRFDSNMAGFSFMFLHLSWISLQFVNLLHSKKHRYNKSTT